MKNRTSRQNKAMGSEKLQEKKDKIAKDQREKKLLRTEEQVEADRAHERELDRARRAKRTPERIEADKLYQRTRLANMDPEKRAAMSKARREKYYKSRPPGVRARRF